MTPRPEGARLDLVLVQEGLARSRGHARELVEARRVEVGGQVATKVSQPVFDASTVRVQDAGPTWVGRAAYKLIGALEAFGPQTHQDRPLDPCGRRCLDAGASTGGFTQVLLHHGAREVVALDVGHDQLAEEVRSDPRVHDLSGTTVRGLTPQRIGGSVSLVVADLSFISLTLVLADLARVIEPDGQAVVLVKPQFEVGRERLGKNGIVRSFADRAWSITAVAEAAVEAGLPPRDLAASPVRGGEGNAEYLLWLTREPDLAMGWETLVARADVLSLEGVS